MIIDGHAHVYADRNARRIVSAFTELHHMEPTGSLGAGTASDLLGKMAESHTDYTVLANFGPVRSVEKINEWTLALSREHSEFIPLVSVYPGMPVSLVREYFDSGAKGIKMHNGVQDYDPADPGLEGIYRFCEERRIPVTFHCGETSRVHLNEYTEMSRFLPVLRRYPEIPFVLTHLAGGDPETVIRTAGECPNAIFDTSVAMTGEEIIHRIHDAFWESDENVIKAFREIGCDRVAFGSDYPFGNPAADIRRILRLSLTEEEKAMILGGNSRRLYFPE